MRKIVSTLSLACLLCLYASPLTIAQRPPELRDDLLDHMVGTWNLEGQVLGKAGHHVLTAEWTLNHQFLKLHEQTSPSAPASERHYEAIWFIGYDDVSEKYVVHLIDVYGARLSEVLGYGTRHDNSIVFTFEYPDGPFHTTYQWLPEQNAWQWVLEQKKNGKWISFADLKLKHASKP
jgi:uncharacterized protein DUF1579